MNVGSVSEIASACAALAALGAVGCEYWHTRRQRRLELAQELAHQLELNDVLRFATTSLDWAVGLVPIPEEWRGVVGKPAIKPDLRAMRAALTPRFPPALQKDPVGLM